MRFKLGNREHRKSWAYPEIPLKLRIHQSGKETLDVEIDQDVLTLGRSSDCDVVLSNPYISKAHVRLLKGVVVQDLESINGTFMDGKRLSMPQVLTGGRFHIGPDDVVIEVVEEDEPAAQQDDARLRALQAENAGLSHEVEELRAQNEFLMLQVQNMKGAGEGGDEDERRARQDQSIGELEELQRNYAELLNRLHEEIDGLLEPAE